MIVGEGPGANETKKVTIRRKSWTAFRQNVECYKS